MSKEEFSISIHKFDITSDTLYQVVSKFDADAPSGFQDFRTTKILDPVAGVGSVNLAVYDDSKGVYDTALTVNSKILTKLYPELEARKSVVRTLTKYIINPVNALKGENVLDPSNFEFWDNESFNITLDYVFDTRNPMDLFHLYCLVVHGNLAPKEFESAPFFKMKAQFSVENKEGVIELTHKKELERNEAIAIFYTMLKNEKSALLVLLDYIKMLPSTDVDDNILNTAFSNWLSSDINQNPKSFIKLSQNYSTPSGKKEIEMYHNLKQLVRKKIVTNKFSEIYLDDESIGNNLQEASKNVLKSKELTQRVHELLSE